MLVPITQIRIVGYGSISEESVNPINQWNKKVGLSKVKHGKWEEAEKKKGRFSGGCRYSVFGT